MTGKELYEVFKDGLNFLGVGFHGMEDVQVTFEHGTLYLSTQTKECGIQIPEKVK